MSSLQKFHRRTQPFGPIIKTIGSEAPIAGSGFWLGAAGDGTSKMYVAPKSTEVTRAWGSYNTQRGTTSTTNGLANTNTLAGFGEAAHPAAYYAKNLTTGGYNTWYLPAKDELNTLYSNKSAAPFVSNDAFENQLYYSSTETNTRTCWGQYFLSGGSLSYWGDDTKTPIYYVRAVRRSTI
jgi:hypothetical protein